MNLSGKNNPFYGKQHTKQTKTKLSEYAKNRIGPLNPNYGNRGILNPLYGKKQTKEHCMKQSQALKGRVFSSEWRNKLSIKAKQRIGPKNSFYGKKHTDETRYKFANRKNGPYKDTKPERMMQIALALNGIKFEKHKAIKIGRYYHQVDIFINPNICVEVDGVYWHLKPENIKRDLFVNQALNLLGYHVIRIRDRDILKNTQYCALNIITMINQLTIGLRLIK